jgi:hypothetical protein
MFSVPSGASPGVHPVAVRRSGQRSNIVNFQVTSRKPFGPPRIDAATIVSATFDSVGAGGVRTLLYVQGANIDVGAVVQINGADVATVAHKGLRNELYGVAPDALAYPIYHYVALTAVAGRRPTGSTITLRVRNLDGRTSDPFEYVLPANAASLDSDGDDIPDAWETAGYDADGDGTIDVNLPALGAHRHRRDIFLKIDIMASPAIPPFEGTFDMVRAMFAAAPVLNPFHASGINLVIDSSGTVPYAERISFNAADSPDLSTARFSTLKANSGFDNAKRGRIYHYAIWAYGHEAFWSGESNIHFAADGTYLGPGNDFFVTVGAFSPRYQTLRSHAESVAHELGHNLGQRHGCVNPPNLCYKPNYWSVMSYAVQLRASHLDSWRRAKVTCLPFYYGDAAARETDGAVYSGDKLRIDYSEGMAATLVEDNNSLDEKKGVCGQPVDWNQNGNNTDVNFNADADRDTTTRGTLADHANWRALDFRGPRLQGAVTP